MSRQNRRDFLRVAAASAALSPWVRSTAFSAEPRGAHMQLGLVTYQWAKDWDLPALLANCEKAQILGVELRTEHAHGVENTLTATQRAEVRKRFDDSPVVLLGPGTNWEFHAPDPAQLKKNMDGAKASVVLSHDVGGTGVKVKPNALPKEVPAEKTIEQIGRALNELGEFGEGYGQQIRVEVHGKETSRLPVMRQIMDIASHKNVTVCWNCNEQDLEPPGLESNFNLVKDRFGDTCHVRELNLGDYPYQQLVKLFAGIDYAGWVLLECRTDPSDKVTALMEQRKVFLEMVAAARV